jgi:hypothetical protein
MDCSASSHQPLDGRNPLLIAPQQSREQNGADVTRLPRFEKLKFYPLLMHKRPEWPLSGLPFFDRPIDSVLGEFEGKLVVVF